MEIDVNEELKYIENNDDRDHVYDDDLVIDNSTQVINSEASNILVK